MSSLRFFSRRVLIGAVVIIVPPAAYAHHTITRLEAKYPPRRPEAFSTDALRAPSNPATQQTPYVDIYSTRVPAAGLLAPDSPHGASDVHSIEEAWARTFFESSLLRAEGQAVASSRSPGDCGEHGFSTGQKLLNGLFEVRRPPAGPGAPLLMGWKMADEPVAFFRRIAAWGYPWRLMSGGRHELPVGEVDAEGMVEVGFSAAHDYEVVAEEGGAQKTIPEWTKRLHRAYAMWLLDERAEEVRRRAKEASRKSVD
ncbi:hypothetical protein L226DRAFT_489595 [Lentinus tigrinus ALCF2SS1-7]|uniref:Uncharacterized protein n=1 Tax=Lentinus tigrinus ALCF2SS1-6 TaxID=1328759 RepID=A0A5C2S562_9APHY|nr:hypothetical protein L227DRAFT_577317 [Lentinus tigrinus ALCF2SS1-6]RPD72904.1 hypothetical protein L226DRAFT_489595 [Lentinus tigrinus ALCF2SS1-7]